MDALADISHQMAIWLQENTTALEPLYVGVSYLISFEVFLGLITLVYWCLNKSLGKSLAYLVVFSNLIIEMVKHAFRDPRPYWLDETIYRGYKEEINYGVPSGHAINATVIYFYVAGWFRKIWVWIAAFLLVFFTIVSRIYLGVHDLEDVLVGFGVGLLILLAFYLWQRYASDRYRNRILGQRLLIALMPPLILAIIYIVVLILLGEPDSQVSWSSRIDLAEKEAIKNFARAFGALVGLTTGFIFESSRIRFLVDGSLWRRALRFLLGILVTGAIWLGLGYIFPEEPVWLATPLQILQTLILSLWVAYYGPLVFVRLGLADARSEPEISLTL